jgi:hypothetical protein
MRLPRGPTDIRKTEIAPKPPAQLVGTEGGSVTEMTGAGRFGAEYQMAEARPQNENSAVVIVSSAGVLAWGLYGVLIVLGHPAAAVCVGIVVMLALVMREYRHGSVNIVDCTSLSFFVVALLTIVTTGHGLFSIYRTIAAWGIFAVVAWATLIAGFPFTLQYARERAPREIWNAAAGRSDRMYERPLRSITTRTMRRFRRSRFLHRAYTRDNHHRRQRAEARLEPGSRAT